MNHPILLFDGVCRFCNAGVNFIIDRDPNKRFRFAPLQSETGCVLLAQFGLRATDLNTVVLIEGGKAYTRSSAGLRVAWLLGRGWSLLAVLVILPPGLRDAVYDLVARNRYRWFGKQDFCRVPTPDVRERFLA